MGVVETAQSFEREEKLDAVWLQVGAFMELYGESALAMNKSFGLAIWYRHNTPTVGVPVTHIDKWAHKTAGLGLKTGIAFQVESGYKVSRELAAVVPGTQGAPGFSATGDPANLGSPASAGHVLNVNEIFSTDVQGIFSPTRTYRKVCDGRYCDHSSSVVVCMPADSADALGYLNQSVGKTVTAIYPDAW